MTQYLKNQFDAKAARQQEFCYCSIFNKRRVLLATSQAASWIHQQIISSLEKTDV